MNLGDEKSGHLVLFIDFSWSSAISDGFWPAWKQQISEFAEDTAVRLVEPRRKPKAGQEEYIEGTLNWKSTIRETRLLI